MSLLTLLLFSCSQMDVFESEDLSARLEESSGNLLLEKFQDKSNAGASTLPDCEAECVESPVIWSDALEGISVFNDAENLVIEFDLATLNYLAPFDLYFAVNGGTIQKTPETINPATGGIFKQLIPLEPGFVACSTVLDFFGLDLNNDGMVDFDYTPNYRVYEICENNGGPPDDEEEEEEEEEEEDEGLNDDKENGDCDPGLNVDLQCNGNDHTATFTFFTEEAGPVVIQGGLTNGTFKVSGSSNVLTQNISHPSVNRSRANVTRWEGEVGACEEVVITITFSGGNGIGNWTAQRNGNIIGSTSAQTCK